MGGQQSLVPREELKLRLADGDVSPWLKSFGVSGTAVALVLLWLWQIGLATWPWWAVAIFIATCTTAWLVVSIVATKRDPPVSIVSSENELVIRLSSGKHISIGADTVRTIIPDDPSTDTQRTHVKWYALHHPDGTIDIGVDGTSDQPLVWLARACPAAYIAADDAPFPRATVRDPRGVNDDLHAEYRARTRTAIIAGAIAFALGGVGITFWFMGALPVGGGRTRHLFHWLSIALPICGIVFLMSLRQHRRWLATNLNRLRTLADTTDGVRCARCGYDLSGLPIGNACPECGK